MARSIYLIICLFCFSSVLRSQIRYNFESGLSEWTQKPENSWGLTTTTTLSPLPSPLSGNASLMHAYKNKETSDTIFVPIKGITFAGHDVTWRFLLKHTEKPSDKNKWVVILAADTISDKLNGYAVGVNRRIKSTSDDTLCLYRITNKSTTYTQIIKTDINWQNSVTVNNVAALEIKRNANGYWRIGIDIGGDFSNISFYNDSIFDETYSDISYLGIVHFFTSSYSQTLYIDDISIDAVDRTPVRAFDTEIIPPNNQIAGQEISSVGGDIIEVMKFGVKDIAGSDALPTFLHQVTVKNVKPPSSADWKTSVKNAFLHAEGVGNLQATNTLITDDSIVFLLDEDLVVPSGDAINMSMKIVLDDSLTDNSTLQFKIDKRNHGFIASTDGSGMAPELTNDVVSGIFTVEVEADTIIWQNVPGSVSANSGFSIIAVATDDKGNIDKDFSYPANLVLLSGSGELSFDPSLAFVNGELNAGNVSYDKKENIVMQLTSQSLTSAHRNISVVFNQNSIINNPAEKISGTTIMSDAVSIENEIPVFRFVIKDSPGDNAATHVSELKFTNPLNNWSNVIGGISLYNGAQRLITNIAEQKNGYIRVELFPGSLTVDDGAEKEIVLKIWLKSKVADKTRLVFTIPATNHGCLATQDGSLFAGSFSQDIVSDTFRVDVQATKIIFKSTPAIFAPDSPFSLEINAVNDDGTIDVDATGEFTLTFADDNGNSFPEITGQLTGGKSVLTGLTINISTIFRIKARHSSFGEVVSDEIVSMVIDTDSKVLPVLSQQKSVFQSTDTLLNLAKEVIRFQINDKGTSDGLPTVVDKMVFTTISGISISDLVGGIELLSDNQNVPASYTSSGNQITVIPDNLTIPDGESREIILKIFLKRVKCADGTKLQLYIPATSHGWTVSNNSSQLFEPFAYPIFSEEHSINVEASRLAVLNQPMLVEKNTPFSLDVGASDYIGNVDTSFNNSISILKASGTGNLQNLSVTQFAGISTFEVIYDSTGSFSFKSVSGGMADLVSMPVYSANHVDTVIKSGMSMWNNTGDWIWSGNKLKHSSGNGFSYVSLPVDIDIAKELVQWDFTIENGNFDPSADNAFWCVLSSDRENLEDENLSGYIAGVNYTGNSDLVSFWKVKAGNKQLLWSSSYDWNVNTTMRIIVQKSENDWQIFMKEKEQPMMYAGKVSDNELLDAGFSGIVFKYTSTRNGLFSINNYEVIKASRFLNVKQSGIIDKDSIKIVFSTDVAFPDALSLDNYSLSSISNPVDIFSVGKISDNEVGLSTQLLSDTLFLLSISGITDAYGSMIKDTVIELRRNVSAANCSLDALNRGSLVLKFNIDMIDSTVTNTNNYVLLNVAGDTFSIKSVTENSGAFYLDCDSLQGHSFILYYKNLETKDGFIINDSVLLKKSYLPAKINKVEAVSSSTVIVEFSRNIREAGEYVIKNSHGTTFNIASKTVNNKQITLTLSGTLSGNSFMLNVAGMIDNEGFAVNDSAYFRYQTVNFGDLAFTEIMAKPNPPVSLPNREYLELYNRTADTIYLTDFRILYGTGKSSRITTGKIVPHGYVVICASASVSELSAYGDAFSATSFPSLLDAGMMLTLTSADSTVIAVVEYDNSFYVDETKSKGGWSLERIDTDNLSDDSNWKASIDVAGGTPCRENSVRGVNPDLTAPSVEKTEFSGASGLTVYFSERVRRDILSINTNYSIAGLFLSAINLDEDEYLNTVELIYSDTFELDRVYELRLAGISDISGNTISDTTIYVFIEAPKVTTSKIANLTGLQITFSESMVASDAQNTLNYRLLSSSNTQLNILGLTLEPTKRKDLTVTTEILRDSLLKLEIKNLKDSRGYSLKDTIIEFYRIKPQTNFKLESANRALLSLTFNINMIDSTILKSANYRLINTEGTVFAINDVRENTSKIIYLDCDSLQGTAFVLYYANLETEDGFILNDSIILEKSYLPAKINKVEAVSSSTVIVEFNKNIQDAGEYVIKNSHGITFNIASKTVNNKQVTLTLSETLSGNSFMLNVSGMEDNEGFTVIDSAYFRYQTVNFGDLAFTEIMAKPNPPVSLPNREYLELYNRTADTIYLTDFRILYGTGKSSRITAGKIVPHGYAVICASASVSELSAYGDAFSATSFPSLLDAGMMLTLTSADSTVIAVVEYNNSFYEDETKSKGGWSLERIDTDNLSDDSNWKASIEVAGGTPCRENSVRGVNPDLTAPSVEKTEFSGASGLTVYFSERVRRDILSINTNYSIAGLSLSAINLDEGEYLNTVELIYSDTFELDRVYELRVAGISDISGNTISDTTIYVFIEAPKVATSKIANLTGLQITFSESMVASDAQNTLNYRLLSSSNTQLNILGLTLEPTKRKDLTVTTEILRDSLLKLEVKNLKDDRGFLLKDTVIKFYRTKPQTNFKLESSNRTLLSLTFNINMVDSAILNKANYRLINTEGTVFAINNIRKNTSKKINLDCDSLQGNAFVLYYNNLETEDGFILNDSIMLEKSYLPATINTTEAVSFSTVAVTYSKNIQYAGEYVIKNSHGITFDVVSKTINTRQVTLTLSETLSGNNFILYIYGMKDNEGFTVNDSAYFRYQTATFGDLAFNEIMAKPNPPVSLPNREYLELYNRTADTIYLTDFRILYGAGKSSRITTGKIVPHGYAVICASASVSELSAYGDVFSATSFPSLLDAGMTLTLTSPDSVVIAVVEYNNSFYEDETKSKGGWSLERIDTDNLSDDSNWKASIDVAGGTPCKENSILGINPDITAPYVETTEFSGISGLIVYFSERIHRDILSVSTNYSISGLSISSINLNEDEYLNVVELTYSEAFELDKVYELRISGISDIAGNTISDTIIYLFIEAPKVTDSKAANSTELQITFSESMIASGAQNILNYKLLSSSNAQLNIRSLTLEPTKRKDLTVKTETLRDSLLKLEVKNLKDDRGFLLKDTIIEFYRTKPQTNFKLESSNRTLLSLTFNINMIDSAILNKANYRLINTEGTVFAINNIRKNTSKKINLDCDSLQGNAFVLYYNNLEAEDGFILNDSVIMDKSYLPAKITKIETTSSSTVIVGFSKNIQKAGDYIIQNSQGTVFDIASKTINNKQVTLVLSEMLSGNSFMLYISKAGDNEGFMINDTVYFRHQTVNFGDLVFNEIMAKPNPPVSLPDREYLELYNRTADTIDLTNFRILYGSGKSSRITAGKIAPRGYAVICTSSAVSELSTYGDVFSATSFPSLLDAGMTLTLTSPDSVIIAVVEYSNSFYKDETKSKGGWSLERIDFDNLSDNSNWKVSTGIEGGTPCRKNSISTTNPDKIQPYIIKTEMINEYSIRVLFSENIVSSTLEKVENYIVRNVGTPSEAKALNAELSNTVELTFDNRFNTGTIYELNISPDIKDFYGNECRGDLIYFGQMYKPEKENLVINEILFNPRSGGSDFVEVYNKSDRILDLSDISIANRNRATGDLQQIHRVSETQIYVQPADYFVFTTDSASLHQFYYVDNPANVVIMSGFPTYPNEDGTVVLLDNEKNIIDEFSYSEDMHGVFVSNPEGVSLERVDFEYQSSELWNWQSAAQTVGFATPTYKNSCYTHTEEEVNKPFVLPFVTFSPDGDGYDDVLFIDYKMPATGFVANIIIFDVNGYFIKEICRNTTLGVEGRLTWDGSKANNTRASIGPYIIYIKAFNANGKVYKYKKVCVLARRR